MNIKKARFVKNRCGAYMVMKSEVFRVAKKVKRDAKGGSSAPLLNVRAMPKTFDFVNIYIYICTYISSRAFATKLEIDVFVCKT